MKSQVWLWPHLVTVGALATIMRNKARSGLAILGIMFAVATVILTIALGRAGTARAQASLAGLGDNLIWIEAGSRNVAGVRTGTRGTNTLTAGDAAAIRTQISRVKSVSENVDGRVQVVYAGRNWNTGYRGVSPEYLDIKRWTVAHGAFFTAEDIAAHERVVVIGETVRRELFGDTDPVGAHLRANGAIFVVVGVLAAKGQSATGQDQDDTLMMPWTTAFATLRIRSHRFLDDIVCSAASSDSVLAAVDDVSDLLRERHRLGAQKPDDFNLRHPEELLNATLATSRTFALFILSVGALVMLVGGVGIMNVMLASVQQRTREIGVRVAVGATPGSVQMQFLGEALMLSLVGAALGVLVSLGAGVVIEARLGWTLATSLSVDTIAVGFALGIGVLFGFYPAILASRLDPIAALRSE